jgi:hypothetical protein
VIHYKKKKWSESLVVIGAGKVRLQLTISQADMDLIRQKVRMTDKRVSELFEPAIRRLVWRLREAHTESAVKEVFDNFGK